MADLIDREALIKALGDQMDRCPLTYLWGLDKAVTTANKLPAVDAVSRGLFEQIKWERDIAMEQLEEHGIAFGAKAECAVDAVEVVHGYWTTTDTILGTCCVCSVCGSCPTMEYKYCPYCGAKMDGERREEDA